MPFTEKVRDSAVNTETRGGRLAVAPGPDALPVDQRPLYGLTVLDFSQFLAGPSCALRLADMGARVIKVERPIKGELGRQLYISNLELDGDSTLFHSINRNKQSYVADLKDPADRERIRTLIGQADVLIQSFRPGVIERLGLNYETVRTLNPGLVYGSVTGYGNHGPWRDKPGQDLLAQSISGIAWLSGNADQGPVPMGLAIADLVAGAHLTQGILACLVRRGITGQGGLAEVSLLESILDIQFEVITTYLNDGGQQPRRSDLNNAHAYLGAPYGIFETANGYLALAMTPVPQLGELLDYPSLGHFTDPKTWLTEREAIKRTLAEHLRQQTTEYWLSLLEPADIWCSDVFTWDQLFAHEGFKVLNMTQRVSRSNGASLETTRCPIRIDGGVLTSAIGAPGVGENTDDIAREFGLQGRDLP